MRLIGKDINLFQVYQQGSGTHTSYVATLKQCEINYEMEMQENGALLDRTHYMQDVRENWTVTFTLQALDAAVPALMTLCQAGTTVTFNVRTATATSGGGFSGSSLGCHGDGALRTARVNIPDGAQELAFEIVPRGALTWAALSS